MTIAQYKLLDMIRQDDGNDTFKQPLCNGGDA